jgi:hypothetical protein
MTAPPGPAGAHKLEGLQMSVGVRPPGSETDRPVLVLAVAAVAVAAVGAIWLAQAALGGRPSYRTVRVDNRTFLPLEVDAAGADGARLGLGVAKPRATTAFAEVVDQGATWTFVVSYGGQEVLRQTVSRQELAGRGWTVQVPEAAGAELVRQGYR